MKKALIIGLFALASLTYAQTSGVVENLTGNKNNTIDTKVLIQPTKSSTILARNRTSVDYENNISNFGLVDLTHNIYDKFDAVAETQFIPRLGIRPRLGLQYFNSFEDLSIFVLYTKELLNEKDNELISLITYKPKLSKDWSIYSHLETITNFNENKHNFSVQRLRLGLKNNGYAFGFASDLSQTRGKEFSYNLGAFVRKSF